MHTYTALYDSRADAEAAQRELQALGILDADTMSIVDQNTPGYSAERGQQTDRGFWASLKNAFTPEDRDVYEEGVRQGGYLLTVNVDDQYADRVEDALERTNAVDIDERENQYRSSGLIPGAADRTDYAATDRTTGVSGEQSIPVVEEQLRVGKRQVNRGGVRARSYVVETPVREDVTLHTQRVEVERRPVNEPLAAGAVAADDLLRERSFEMTETAEEAVVSKEARVVEEVVFRNTEEDRTETVEDTVRRTEVDVERLPGSEGAILR